MNPETKYPSLGMASLRYKRLEDANLLDKIPDRIDPNAVFSDDEESPEKTRPEDESGASNFTQESSSGSLEIMPQLSYKERLEKFDKMYTEIMQKVSKMDKKSRAKASINPSSNLLEVDPKVDVSSKSTSKTWQSTYSSQQPSQQFSNSSLTNVDSILARQLFPDSVERKHTPSELSGKVLWKGPLFFERALRAQSSAQVLKEDSFLQNTSANTIFSSSDAQLKKATPHAPRKVHSVRSFWHDLQENVPPPLELEVDSSILSEKEFPSSFLNSPLPCLQQKEDIVAKTDAACSPIQYPSECKEEKMWVNKKEFYILSQIGCGGSCKVFAAFDKGTRTVVAIKQVNIANADASIKNELLKEMKYLKLLQNSNHVINMFDFECRKGEMLLVMEKGDTDLASFLNDAKTMQNLTPLMVKFYWSQMLTAVSEIHEHGIIHSDLKPANFLLVSGHLKLIDFGISASVPTDMTSAIRSTRAGTINYMSPEAVITYSANEDHQALFKVGVKSDVWSLGCILYNLVYGHTPFQKIRLFAVKLDAITNPDYVISFPPINDSVLLDVMKQCLKRDPKERASVEELLNHPYLKMEEKYPVQCQQGGVIKGLMEKIEKLSLQHQFAVAKYVEDLSM